MTKDKCMAARKILGWSRAVLAQKAGISQRTLVNFEHGLRTPRKNNLKAIVTAFKDAGITIILSDLNKTQ